MLKLINSVKGTVEQLLNLILKQLSVLPSRKRSKDKLSLNQKPLQ